MPKKEKTISNTQTTITNISFKGDESKPNTFSITILNKIPQKVQEFQNKTGCTRRWLALKLGMSTQNMYKIFEASNVTLETLIKFAYVLQCDISDLFEYEVTTDD